MAYSGSSSCTKESGSGVFSVLNYGAVGDGITDDSGAFLAAWTSTCGAVLYASTLFIPEGKTFLLNPLKFEGPCKSLSINIQVYGNIVAPDKAAWTGQNLQDWLVFLNLDGLIVDGSGLIDGHGSSWWDQYKGLDDFSVG
ncbi:Glycosidase [Sarracenia purpurea var. burkii]